MNKLSMIFTLITILFFNTFTIAQRLPVSEAENEGMSSERLDRIKPLMQKYVDEDKLPGPFYDITVAGNSFNFFDNFFLGIVLLVIATGVLAEMARYWFPAEAAMGAYVLHLGAVLCLFLTFSYSKFAHLLYRTMAMVHERMVAAATQK